MDIFAPIRFKTSIQLSPADLVESFEDILLKKLRNSLEGVCTRYGYIRPKTIEILKRSCGLFVKQHFNGHVRFDMVCRAEVCNPVTGMVLEAVVKNKNALGLHAESYVRMDSQDVPVLDILIPKRTAGIASEIDLDEVQIHDKIYVEVLGKRYQLRDRKIEIIGRALKEAKKMMVKTEQEEEVTLDLDEQQGGELDIEESDAERNESERGESDADSDEEEVGRTRQVNIDEESEEEVGEEEYDEEFDDMDGGDSADGDADDYDYDDKYE